MDLERHLICPICRGALFKEASSLKCERGHSYDFSKSGYINLLNPGKKNNAKAGDSKEMIRARSDFFLSGAYSKINEELCKIVSSFSPKFIVDAGCGDGYYTLSLAKDNQDAVVFGFDMSKFGAEHASRSARGAKVTSTLFSVSNIFDMPLKDSCADVIVNMFAPVASEEFSRVLKPNGYLIVGASGKSHLDGLKRAIYDEVYLNEPSEHSYEGFDFIECRTLKYDVTITGNDTIQSLFQMTPYYHRTSLKDKEKLTLISSVSTTIEVDFLIFKSKKEIDYEIY